jgi:hypothetical protein
VVWILRAAHADGDSKVIANRCDICDDRTMCSDEIESQIDVQNEIDNSFESKYNKHESRLLLFA